MAATKVYLLQSTTHPFESKQLFLQFLSLLAILRGMLLQKFKHFLVEIYLKNANYKSVKMKIGSFFLL